MDKLILDSLEGRYSLILSAKEISKIAEFAALEIFDFSWFVHLKAI